MENHFRVHIDVKDLHSGIQNITYSVKDVTNVNEVVLYEDTITGQKHPSVKILIFSFFKNLNMDLKYEKINKTKVIKLICLIRVVFHFFGIFFIF